MLKTAYDDYTGAGPVTWRGRSGWSVESWPTAYLSLALTTGLILGGLMAGPVLTPGTASSSNPAVSPVAPTPASSYLIEVTPLLSGSRWPGMIRFHRRTHVWAFTRPRWARSPTPAECSRCWVGATRTHACTRRMPPGPAMTPDRGGRSRLQL